MITIHPILMMHLHIDKNKSVYRVTGSNVCVSTVGISGSSSLSPSSNPILAICVRSSLYAYVWTLLWNRNC